MSKGAGSYVFLIISRSPRSFSLTEPIPGRFKIGFYMVSTIQELRPFCDVISIWKGTLIELYVIGMRGDICYNYLTAVRNVHLKVKNK
jgi:hypothetical protein